MVAMESAKRITIMETFDRFDVCEAYYVFANGWHMGQDSDEYAIFGRLENIHFKPSPSLTVETLSENGKRILQDLIEKQKIAYPYLVA